MKKKIEILNKITGSEIEARRFLNLMRTNGIQEFEIEDEKVIIALADVKWVPTLYMFLIAKSIVSGRSYDIHINQDKLEINVIDQANHDTQYTQFFTTPITTTINTGTKSTSASNKGLSMNKNSN